MTLLLALACFSDPPQDSGPVYAPLTWEVEQPGPYNVGYRSTLVEYETPLGELRTLTLNLWYPTVDSSGEAVQYTDGRSDSEAIGRAAFADPAYSSGYPVYLHSHDAAGHGAESAFLMRHLASHGWLTLAPDHPGALLSEAQEISIAMEIHRASDLGAAWNYLEGQAAADALGRADTSAVLVGGLGAGAAAAWALGGAKADARALEEFCAGLEQGCTNQELDVLTSGALAEARVSGTLSLNATVDRRLFGESGHASLAAPLMVVSGSTDSPLDDQGWAELSGVQGTWVSVEGACSQSFRGEDCAELPASQSTAIQGYATAFGRVHLLNDDTHAELLDGTRLLTEGVRVQTAD